MRRFSTFILLLAICISSFAAEDSNLGVIRDIAFSYVTSVESSTKPTVHFYETSDGEYKTPLKSIPLSSLNTAVDWGAGQYVMRYNQNGASGKYNMKVTCTPFKSKYGDTLGYSVMMFNSTSLAVSKNASSQSDAVLEVEGLSSQTVFTFYYRFSADDINALPANITYESNVTVYVEPV